MFGRGCDVAVGLFVACKRLAAIILGLPNASTRYDAGNRA
jgi:hypothetical protein